MGTATCRLGELEIAARRQREEEQAFGELLPSERTPGAVSEACFVFHIAFSSLDTEDYRPARSRCLEASPQGQWGEHGVLFLLAS